MRRHFFGKDHKQAKSLKLQKQLQEEEDAKWAEELARRREQERLDEELARKLQEELEQENNEQPGTASLGSPQVQQSSSSTPSNPNNNPSTPPPLPSKPRAYVSSSSSTNQTAATSSARASQPAPAPAPAPSFSSTSVVPDRERPVAARPSPSSNLTSSADTLPPPYAVHRNHHGANSSQMSLPSLPRRQSTPQPSSFSTTHTGGYHPPSAPSFANTTPAPITQAQERPITPISHASSPMPPATYMQNQQPSRPSYPLGAPPPQQHSPSSSYQTSVPQQQPSTLSYQSSAPQQQQQQQQQPIYSHANAPTSPVMNGTPSNGYPPSYPNVTPAPQSSSPKAPPAVPSPTNVDPQQFTPPSGYAPQQPPPSPHPPPPPRSYTTMPVPHVKTITASTIPTNTAARPTVDPPNKYPSEPSMGATLFGQQQPRREPMMFVPPPQAVTTADQYTPPTPTAATATDRHHHHRPPQSRQYMSMPVPDPAGYRASPRQTPASAATTSASLSSMKPPQQQQGTATHISPLDSVSPPITLNVASKSSTANAKRESPQDNSAKKNKQPEQHARNNSSTVDYFDSPSVSIPGPALQPERVGNMIPKKKRARKAYKPDEPDPFADEFAVEEEFSSPEEKDDHDDDEIVEEQRREKPHEKEDGKKTRVDKGKARAAIHDAQEEEEDEEEEEEEATTTRKDEQHNDKEKDEHDTATTKRDELPEGFNPADYFDEHDLVDLNAPSDYGSDDDNVSSCDEDHIATEEKAEVTTTTTTSRPKSMGYATRIEPGGASMIDLSSFNKDKKDYVRNRRRSDSASPSVSMMQERLADLLVDASWPEEKTQETQEIVHTPIPTLSHSRSRSMSSLYPPDGSSQVSLHLPPSTPYMPGGGPVAQPLYSRVGTPYMMHGGNVYMDQRYIRDVPSNEYGYYKVQPEQSNNNNNSSSVDVSASNDTKDKPKAEKQLPKIPKSDPNHRHITVPSINPGQRVWIRVKPTDTGRELANRIHIVATYKTRKILKITTANGTDVPLDDTPVFEDWNEIEKLQDGAPWKVEWGPMDRDLFGGRQLLRHIKAGLRAAGKE